MNDPEKTKNREADKKEWLQLRRLGLAAITGFSIIGAGNLGDHLRQDNYIELDKVQRDKLTSANEQMLGRISKLPFSEQGSFEQTAENSKRPGFHNTLKVQLKHEGDTLVIKGEGRHKGLSNGPSSKSNGQKVPFDDPASFSVVFPIDKDEAVHTIPTELLKEVMTDKRMPTKVDYQLTEKRPSRGRGDSEGMGSHETALDVTLGTSEGKITSAQVGDKGLFANSDDLTEEAEEIYRHINDELGRILTP